MVKTINVTYEVTRKGDKEIRVLKFSGPFTRQDVDEIFAPLSAYTFAPQDGNTPGQARILVDDDTQARKLLEKKGSFKEILEKRGYYVLDEITSQRQR